ncbi:hypothetical protein C4561_02540 [candidate division WWE3 bacterium]|uniref:Uncharacterized protein n=1 Tax=candidate division WWE3 bacterium TaxID=2053526 RepID=A0A3A4ZDI2_UNCKA|nr:MAG: hypothetical protein C4561_02540 [candidate division WWE3 bacterium]
MQGVLLVVHNADYYYAAETALVVESLGNLANAMPLPAKLAEYNVSISEEEDPDTDLQALADASGNLVFYFEVDPDEGWTMEYGFYWPEIVQELEEIEWSGTFPEGLYVDDADDDEEEELIEPEEPQFGMEPSVQESSTNLSLLFIALAVLIVLGAFFVLVLLYQNGFQLPADFTIETLIEYLGF